MSSLSKCHMTAIVCVFDKQCFKWKISNLLSHDVNGYELKFLEHNVYFTLTCTGYILQES